MNRDTIILKRYILSGEKAEICSNTLDGTNEKERCYIILLRSMKGER